MAAENSDLFQRIGIDIDSNKINIDLNKTKSFFASLQGLFQEKAESLKQDIQAGKVDLGEEVGIQVDDAHINIDLEKTKGFVEDLGKKVENFLAELDSAVKKIDTE